MQQMDMILTTLFLAGIWIIAFLLIYFFISLGEYIYYTHSEGEKHEKKSNRN